MPSRFGVQFSYTIPPDSFDSIDMADTSPSSSIDFTGSVRLAADFNVAKLWLIDVADPSDPSVFVESAMTNVNGNVWIRNEYKKWESILSRSSITTFVNSSGLIEVVQPNVPRNDHDPATLVLKDLLIVEARTNRIL